MLHSGQRKINKEDLMTNELAIPETLPATADALVEYGRNCLYVGKIATEQFGKACQALLDGEGSWTQRKVADAMGCGEDTVRRALQEAGFKIKKIAPSDSDDHETPEPPVEDPVDGEIVEDDEIDGLPPAADLGQKADKPLFDYTPEQAVHDAKETIVGQLELIAGENLPDPERALLRDELHNLIDKELA
jgi:hypothetical protein